MSIIKPRIFISYAREDMAIAEAINSHLQTSYKTFFDKKSILIGDPFPEKILLHIKKCDGCITIISPSSVVSEWCKLEIYFAHLLKKTIIPIKIGTADFEKNSPLQYLQKSINYTIIEDISRLPEALSLIDTRLSIIRKSARKRIAKAFFGFILAGLIIYAFFSFGINRINGIKYNNDRSELLSEIKKSDKIYRDSAIEGPVKKFRNDQWLISQLHLLELDPGLSAIVRINAKILSANLQKNFNMAQRQYFGHINWGLSTLQNTVFVNSSLTDGYISQVDFKNVEFSDVYFNGIVGNEKGIVLSGLQFSNCGFNAVYLDKNNAIDLAFENCRFKGSYLDITNFGAVRFTSHSDDSVVITNGQVGFFENCWFNNSNTPALPGVVDLGKEDEVLFTNIVFKSCRFTGLVRKEWFKNCSFEDCNFPKGVDIK
jgi:uncharacterized protein YjbI with pentapeptide repeats